MPEELLKKKLRALGDRGIEDLKTDERGFYVWLADGHEGVYKYYIR